MTDLLTSAQMRAFEQAAIESGAVTGLGMMEMAGEGVVAAIYEEWPDLAAAPHRAMVLCGPGNNGGDGYVIARLLAEAGWQVDVFCLGTPDRLPPDARESFERWQGDVRDVAEFDPDAAYDLMVDACFGTGLARPVEDGPVARGLSAIDSATWDWRRWKTGAPMRGQPPRTVAVDVPSGLCADSGHVLGQVPGDDPFSLGGDQSGLARRCAQVLLTVSFHCAKPGHYLAMGPRYCGRLVVKGIGLDPRRRAIHRARLVARHGLSGTGEGGHGGTVTSLTDRGHAAPLFSKGQADHKFSHGHALVLCGPAGATGAARLAARGALRIGAGLVTVGAPSAAMAECAAQLTAIMLREVPDAAALRTLLLDSRITALCLGPGLGLDDRARRLVEAVLRSGLSCVLDADALSLLATHAPLARRLHPRCLLTPHGGEFARLFPDLAERLRARPDRGPAFSKIDAVRAAAARLGASVLFKGADTVMADAQGNTLLNAAVYEDAAPWLATAGSGDVLAGFATGAMARGMSPLAAGAAAAWLHAEAARQFGPGLVAEDLPEFLPEVFRSLARGRSG